MHFIHQYRIEAVFRGQKIFTLGISLVQFGKGKRVAEKQFKIAVTNFDICFHTPAINMPCNCVEPVIATIGLQQQAGR